MTRNVAQRDEACDDLIDIFTYFGERSIDAARRFLRAADETFQRLAAMPGLGEPFESPRPELADVR